MATSASSLSTCAARSGQEEEEEDWWLEIQLLDRAMAKVVCARYSSRAGMSTCAARSAFWSVNTPRRSFIPSFSAARSWFSRVNWLSLMFSYMTRQGIVAHGMK